MQEMINEVISITREVGSTADWGGPTVRDSTLNNAGYSISRCLIEGWQDIPNNRLLTFPTRRGEVEGVLIDQNFKAQTYLYMARGGGIFILDEFGDAPAHQLEGWKHYFFLGIKAVNALAAVYQREMQLDRVIELE